MLRLLLSIILVILLAVASVVYYSHWQVGQSMPIKEQQLYKIEQGTSFHHLLKDFKSKQWISSRFAYRVYAKLSPENTRIKTGTYQLQPNMSFLSALWLFTEGDEYQFKITFIEGSTFKEWLAQFKQAAEIKFTLKDESYKSIMAKFDTEYHHPEGVFFPDTYSYVAGTKDVDILKQALQRMHQELATSWQSRAKKLPYKSSYEALIMASIIEKETGQVTEQPIISSVFVNRLAKRMRLQTDPTIIYGLGERYTGDITYANIREKTAYNTYQIAGLPPTPIAMPGKSAIEATMHPANTSFLYFVSKGNGEHYFSKSLKEHNQAVRRYIKGSK